MSRFGKLRRALLASDPHCAYCGDELTLRNSSIDHIVPRAAGGSSEQSNIVLACRRCNFRKADLRSDELLAWTNRVLQVCGCSADRD